MTALVIIASLGVLLSLAAVLLIRRFRLTNRTATLADLDTLFDNEVDRYGHVARLLAPADFQFLQSNRRAAGLAARLRSSRIAVLRMYLSKMRDEFESLMALSALFAATPTAQSERFGQRLAQVRMHFEWRMFRLRLRLTATHFGRSLDLGPVGDEIRTLRSQSERILRALAPEDLQAMRAVLNLS